MGKSQLKANIMYQIGNTKTKTSGKDKSNYKDKAASLEKEHGKELLSGGSVMIMILKNAIVRQIDTISVDRGIYLII